MGQPIGSIHNSRITLDILTFEDGTDRFPKISVRNCLCTLCNIPEEHRSHVCFFSNGMWTQVVDSGIVPCDFYVGSALLKYELVHWYTGVNSLTNWCVAINSLTFPHNVYVYMSFLVLYMCMYICHIQHIRVGVGHDLLQLPDMCGTS